MQLSIVIPAYNEASRLPATLERIVEYLGDNPSWLPAEILVVDDGSQDETSSAARAVPTVPQIHVKCLLHRQNRGKGAAVRTGFGNAKGDVILLCDADLATPIEELEHLAAACQNGVAFGSRAIDRSRIETPQPWYRDFMGRVFNLAVRIVALTGVDDTQCGFKLFDGDLGRELAAQQRIDGFAFDVELLVLASSWGYPVCEVPIRWRHVEASRVQPVTHSVQMLRDLLCIGWWRLTGRLPSMPPARQ